VGSVKSAVVYDRGTCAFIIDDLQTRVRDRTRRTWNELAGVVRDIPTLGLSNLPISRDRHRTETYVEIDGRSNETRGGFVFASALEVDLPFGFNNLKVGAGYDFPFRMNDEGMIEAPAEGLNLIVTGGGIFGDPITNNVVQFIVTDEIQSRLGDVTDELQDEQWVDAGELVDITEPLCTPLNPLPPVEQCATLRPPLRIVTGLGLSNMRAEGLVEENEVDEATLLDNYDQANNWRCRESRCQLRVQAKRLNVYPDAVELVFFDEPELALTGYALFVAAHAAEGNDRRRALRTLCRRRKATDSPSASPAGAWKLARGATTSTNASSPTVRDVQRASAETARNEGAASCSGLVSRSLRLRDRYRERRRRLGCCVRRRVRLRRGRALRLPHRGGVRGLRREA
jgi:hypothetical protein